MKAIKKDQLEECKNAFHDTSKELALIWHKEAQKTKNPDTYVLAMLVYKEFLERFPEATRSPTRWRSTTASSSGPSPTGQGSWKDAAEQYTKVVELNPKGKYVKEAAYAAVLAWKNALNVDDHEQKEPVEKDRKKFKSKKGDEARAAGHPRVPEEDDRGLRDLHEVRARRAGARDDQVPRGAHLLRVQPLRRRAPSASRTSSTSTPSTSWRSTRPTCCSTRSTRRARPKRS